HYPLAHDDVLPVSIQTPSSPSPPFLFHHPPPTLIYSLSLHDALPIWSRLPLPYPAYVDGAARCSEQSRRKAVTQSHGATAAHRQDRKSTRLNSSHGSSSYAVFCLKKKSRDRRRAVR